MWSRMYHQEVVEKLSLAKIKYEQGDFSMTRVKPGYYVYKSMSGALYHIEQKPMGRVYHDMKQVELVWFVYRNNNDNMPTTISEFWSKSLRTVKSILDKGA